MKCPRILGTLALLAACHSLVLASGDSPVKKRDLIVWGVTLTPDSKGVDAVNKEFERRHPDINLRLLSIGAGGMDPQKLMTSIVGNVAPDVIAQDRFSISDWASRDAFRSLDDLLARDQGKDPLCPAPSQYYPATWAEASYGGKVYGIPSGADDRILYYNKAIFRENADALRAAGLDPDRPPRTWSELLAYSKVLTIRNQDGTLKRAGFLPNFGNSWLYLYAFQNDASFMLETGPNKGRVCTMDTPASEEALKFMVEGYDLVGGYEVAKSFESGFLSKENDAFFIGKVAMKIDGNWILDDMSRYSPSIDLGVAPAPVPDDRYNGVGRFKGEDKFVTWTGGYCWAIPKGARNVQDAWEYIKFETSTEGRELNAAAQREWDRHLGRTYIPDLSASIAANQVMMQKFKPADAKFAAALQEHIDMMPYGRIRPATFVGQVLWDEQTKAMEAACYHKLSPKNALIAGQVTVQRDLDAFFERGNHPEIDLEVPAKIGIGLVILTLIGFAIAFLRLKIGRLARSEALWAYLFISPWVIGFVVLTLGPMIASLFFSFTQYDVLSPARWVGFKNFQDMFGADRANVFRALGNAAYLAGLGVPLGLATGLAIALLLNSAARGMRYYRTFFYMPSILPTIASAVLWTWVLTPDPNKGLINSYWVHFITPTLGISPPGWLQSADWAKNALVVQGVWGAGGGMILWLAGLKGVPTSLYEASGIDGATPRQQFWSITFPQLSPIIFFNLVMGFIGAMQEFDRAYAMKPSGNGPIGPDDSLLTPVYLLFQNGFSFFRMGYASALAWMIFGIIILLTYSQFKLAPRWVHYEADK
jgi:multiple sugar transport system permease protein